MNSSQEIIDHYISLINDLEDAAGLLDSICADHYAYVCENAAEAIEELCDMCETLAASQAPEQNSISTETNR